jgi:flagellin
MSLVVLNNINAIYAENNLNNTSNSLSTVLQQLSSGSKINSGADDAAGLSLVNGLQANSVALSQSKTNSQEGVGLLQVADGALSQVTSLLNRAVTLATEASNGTLNSSQDAAANQEFQSILSEVNNIGSTTTYNAQKVFGGADVAVYTGDSSTQSASVDNLHFANVTSASLGDANGTMQYSAGQGVFTDLQKSATAGTVSGLDQAGVGTLTFSSWDVASQSVVTKSVTSTANETVNAFITQINSAGLGVSASLTTSANATGDATATKADLGIEITGAVQAGVTPTAGAPMMELTNTSYKDGVLTGAVANTSADSGTGSAMISYKTGTGGTSDLTQNNLTTQAGAQATLTTLNAAITNVAAQDGYIGAQINTLNAVSSVLSTQGENVTAAQNAVQATDYAAASSNMSKYEILSQTGISALAQANSVQQEVTKLLQ